MKPQQTYVVLATRGSGWEIHGPLAQEFRTLKDAESAARDLSIRYPQQTIGVYELRFVFGTQQKVVKKAVEVVAQPAARRREQTAISSDDNVIKLRSVE
jgi:hypothetical protein